MSVTISSAPAYADAAPVNGTEAPFLSCSSVPDTVSAPDYATDKLALTTSTTTPYATVDLTTSTSPAYPGTQINGYPATATGVTDVKAQPGMLDGAQQFVTTSAEYNIPGLGKKKIPGWAILVTALLLLLLFCFLCQWLFGKFRSAGSLMVLTLETNTRTDFEGWGFWWTLLIVIILAAVAGGVWYYTTQVSRDQSACPLSNYRHSPSVQPTAKEEGRRCPSCFQRKLRSLCRSSCLGSRRLRDLKQRLNYVSG